MHWQTAGLRAEFGSIDPFPQRAHVKIIPAIILAIVACVSAAAGAVDTAAPQPTYADLLKSSAPSDWRPLDEDNTLYLEIPAGRVVIELSPAFAPLHATNIKALVRERYFDGLSIIRSQDNYVVQWGDPTEKKPITTAKKKLPPEFTVPIARDMAFTRLPDIDGYAKLVGFSNGFHAARSDTDTWLAHCYGAVGVGRDSALDSGGGAELYVVTGHAPRHLDRNIALVGRVVAGMPLLSSLPRGTGALGFYEKAEQYVPIRSIRIASDVPSGERTHLEVIRTDTALFGKLVESLRNRGGDWYKVPAGHIELCNMPIAVRAAVSKPQ